MTRVVLTDGQKQDLTRQYAGGKTPTELSGLFGVHKHSVLRIVRACGGAPKPSGRKVTYAIDSTAFDTVTEDSAYWAGMIMADGCVVDRGKDVALQITLSGDDGSHLERLRQFLKADAPLRRRDNAGPDGWNGQAVTKFETYSSAIVYALSKYGVVPRKSKTAKVIGLEFNRHFWRGVLDGDGCLTTGKSGLPILSLIGSYDLMTQFKTYCHSIDSGIRAQVRREVNAYVFRIAGRFAVNVIAELYEGCTVALPRKLAKATAIISRRTRRFEP